MSKIQHVKIKPEEINLEATMVRSLLTAGITATKAKAADDALCHLRTAKCWLELIIRQVKSQSKAEEN